MERVDRSSSGGFHDGSDVGVELGAPLGSKAVGDLSEDDAGSQGLLGAVVRRRNVAVGDEDEQVLPEALDNPLEFLSGLGVRHDLEQFVELGLELGMVGDEGGIGQGGDRCAPRA